MHLDKSIQKEEAYTGEELLASNGISDLDRKCFVVKQTVTDGDFTLEEALDAYGVTKEDFEKYLAKYLVSELKIFVLHSSSPTLAVISSIAVFGNMYKELLADVDADSDVIQNHLQDLSKGVTTGKVPV